jgi:hypothetical protein
MSYNHNKSNIFEAIDMEESNMERVEKIFHKAVTQSTLSRGVEILEEELTAKELAVAILMLQRKRNVASDILKKISDEDGPTKIKSMTISSDDLPDDLKKKLATVLHSIHKREKGEDEKTENSFPFMMGKGGNA